MYERLQTTDAADVATTSTDEVGTAIVVGVDGQTAADESGTNTTPVSTTATISTTSAPTTGVPTATATAA